MCVTAKILSHQYHIDIPSPTSCMPQLRRPIFSLSVSLIPVLSLFSSTASVRQGPFWKVRGSSVLFLTPHFSAPKEQWFLWSMCDCCVPVLSPLPGVHEGIRALALTSFPRAWQQGPLALALNARCHRDRAAEWPNWRENVSLLYQGSAGWSSVLS